MQLMAVSSLAALITMYRHFIFLTQYYCFPYAGIMAVKVLQIPNENKRAIVDELQREIDLMKTLKHPNIVRYLGAEVDTSRNILNIFQEWVPGGCISTLLKKFGPFSINVVKSYLTQILDGLDYLHCNGIIHRDIKVGLEWLFLFCEFHSANHRCLCDQNCVGRKYIGKQRWCNKTRRLWCQQANRSFQRPIRQDGTIHERNTVLYGARSI